MHQLHPPVEVLDDGGARVDPVAAVEVGDAVDLALRGGVDVAADDAVGAAAARVACDGLLELEDEGERGLHLALGEAGQRPVAREAEVAPQP